MIKTELEKATGIQTYYRDNVDKVTCPVIMYLPVGCKQDKMIGGSGVIEHYKIEVFANNSRERIQIIQNLYENLSEDVDISKEFSYDEHTGKPKVFRAIGSLYFKIRAVE